MRSAAANRAGPGAPSHPHAPATSNDRLPPKVLAAMAVSSLATFGTLIVGYGTLFA